MRVKDAARIFSSNYLIRLASGDFSLLNHVARDLLNIEPANLSVVDVFEQTYKQLSKCYRHEYYFKNTIANKRLLGSHSLNTATMLSEFRVGRNIADCVILNGQSTCYEIKTEFGKNTKTKKSTLCMAFLLPIKRIPDIQAKIENK